MDKKAALDKIGIGSTIVILGLGIGAVLEYLVKMVLARYLGPELYGVFIQGFAISSAVSMLALLGFHMSLPRFMSYYRGRDDAQMAENSFLTSLYLVVPSSLFFSILLYLSSKWISLTVLNEPSLLEPLKLLSLTIVPLSLFYLTIAFMRGVKNARYKVVLDDILLPGIELVLILVFFFAGYSLIGAVYAYIISLVAILIACYYFYRRVSGFSSSSRKFIPGKLLNFSWPLFIISILLLSNKWSDILILGWLKDSVQVGIYEVAFAVSSILTLLLNSLNYMFMPVVSELYGEGKISEVLDIYATSTRWIFVLTLPIFAGILIFPRQILELLFGISYTAGALSLRIVAVGFFYHTLVGPAGMILLSTGETRSFMAGTAVVTGVDILFNFLLIPEFGIVGAAIATALGFIVGNTVYLIFVKNELNGLPYNHRYFKPIIGILIASATIYLLKIIIDPGLVANVFLGFVLTSVYVLILYLVEGFQEEDYELLENIISLVL